MTILQTIAPEEASGKTAELFHEIEGAFGRVPAVVQVYGLSPEILAQQWDGIQYYRHHPRLGAALLATIRMLVSQANQCDYCVGFNEAMLINHLGQSPEAVAATKRDPRAAPLSDGEKAMLLLVLKAVQTPASLTREDVEAVLAQGWTESDVLDAVVHGARNQMADVIINAFKVERDF
ncbi:carboxymuconolactone decarboxylase family protein [Acidithiobacillus sulfuriphilus]|uniref:Carboxymuconolactone decarboxylase family protein n=2 Tax=Acidithiobacillus sulfuriphilus TaxID=1867749 RepID=A0A3M8QWP2_9PROT|nr:hypothetical protein [Acidithiobacillus sulfuriphilus]RNF59414.1 hypothetical protein EC580_11540 [Acidithiobacillus sulfuriphilus]